jgi:Trk K+ transport system NAD-binding subunit
MVMPNNYSDQGELVEFEIEEEPKWITVKLKDGSVIQIKMEIVAIMRNGNDMNSGLPIYMVQATNIIRLTKVPKELMSKKKIEDQKGQTMYR